jgi:hypothetical protein
MEVVQPFLLDIMWHNYKEQVTAITNDEPMPEIAWTSYLRHRAALRGFDLGLIENILRFSSERYYDVETDRASTVDS